MSYWSPTALALVLFFVSPSLAGPIHIRLSDASLSTAANDEYFSTRLHLLLTGSKDFTVQSGQWANLGPLWKLDDAPSSPPSSIPTKTIGNTQSAIDLLGFSVRVKVTNLDNGESGNLFFSAGAGVNWAKTSTGPNAGQWQLIENYTIPNTSKQTLFLNGLVHEFEASAASATIQQPPLLVNVHPVETPEPATLMLALVGLPLVGLVRSRLRK